jgi:hypothetical protein
MSKPYQVHDKEWVRLAPSFKLKCCDCSLVHRVNVRIVKGCILMRFTRCKAR